MAKRRQDTIAKDELELADRLHSGAIHLLRRVRSEDVATGLTAPRLSALSVIVYGGPITISDLAAAEQVRRPTISRLVKELEQEGLVRRMTDPSDERMQWISATARGRRLLHQGRQRRVAKLATDLAGLSVQERRALARAAAILERLTLPPEHPGPAV